MTVIFMLISSPTFTFAALTVESKLSALITNFGVTAGGALSTQLTSDCVASGICVRARLRISMLIWSVAVDPWEEDQYSSSPDVSPTGQPRVVARSPRAIFNPSSWRASGRISQCASAWPQLNCAQVSLLMLAVRSSLSVSAASLGR